MINKIREMLDRGERIDLKLADKMGFIEQGANPLVADGLQGGINTVCYINSDNNVVVRASGLDDMLFVQSDDYLKYFKIKEPEYTFNDLIDAAAQAFKDGALAKVTMMSEGLIYLTTHDIRVKSVSDDIPSSGIDFIKSLYTETFVIESEEDIKRVKKGAVITLANGNSFDVALSTQLGRGWVLDTKMNELDQHQTYCIFVLAGATVTQSAYKGENNG